MVSLLNKNSKLLVIKILIIKIIKMILTIKVIVVITIIITMIMKCRGRCRMPTTTNNRAPCDITEWPKAFK